MKAYMRDGSNNTDGQTLHKASLNKGKDLVHMLKTESRYSYIVLLHILIQYSNNLIS